MTLSAMLVVLFPCVAYALTPLEPEWKSEVLTKDTGSVAHPSTAVKVDGNYAYHLSRDHDGSTGWLTIVDISNPSSPTKKSEKNIASATYMRDIVISGNTAYISHRAIKDATSTSNVWSGLTVMNIADKTAPTEVTKKISASDATWLKQGDWGQMEKHGNYLYAVVGKNSQSLAILDVTDPAATPVLQGEVFNMQTHVKKYQSNQATALAVSNDVAYVMAGSSDGWMIVLDVKDKTSPKLLFASDKDTCRETGAFYAGNHRKMFLMWPTRIRIVGAFAVASARSGITILDVSKVQSSKEVSVASELVIRFKEQVTDNDFLHDVGEMLDLQVENDFAFITSKEGKWIAVADIADKYHPKWVGAYKDETKVKNPKAVYVAGKILYVAGNRGSDSKSGMFLFDVPYVQRSGPTPAPTPAPNPSAVSSQAPSFVKAVTLKTDFTREKDWTSPSMHIDGNYGYLVQFNVKHEEAWLTIVDLSDPSDPKYTSSKNSVTGKYGFAVVADGNYAYMSCDSGSSARSNGVYSGLIVWDVSNKASPSKITDEVQASNTGWVRSGKWQQMEKHGKYLYVGKEGRYEPLVILDVSDPTKPTLTGQVYRITAAASLTDWEKGGTIAVYGDIVFAAANDNHKGWILALDASDKANVALITSLDSAKIRQAGMAYTSLVDLHFLVYPKRMRLSGDHLVVASKESVTILDVSTVNTSKNMTIVGEARCEYKNNPQSNAWSCGNYHEMQINNDHAILTNENPHSLHVLDISDKTVPQWVGFYQKGDHSYKSWGGAVKGNHYFQMSQCKDNTGSGWTNQRYCLVSYDISFSASMAPTAAPTTAEPTTEPTSAPTTEPSAAPTAAPTALPTIVPTPPPTDAPTAAAATPAAPPAPGATAPAPPPPVFEKVEEKSFDGASYDTHPAPTKPLENDFTITAEFKTAFSGGSTSSWRDGVGLLVLQGDSDGSQGFGVSLGGSKVMFGMDVSPSASPSGPSSSSSATPSPSSASGSPAGSPATPSPTSAPGSPSGSSATPSPSSASGSPAGSPATLSPTSAPGSPSGSTATPSPSSPSGSPAGSPATPSPTSASGSPSGSSATPSPTSASGSPSGSSATPSPTSPSGSPSGSSATPGPTSASGSPSGSPSGNSSAGSPSSSPSSSPLMITSTATYADDKWHRVVANRDAATGTYSLWIDDAIQGTVQSSVQPPKTTRVHIGRNLTTGSSSHFVGSVKNVKTFAEPLDPVKVEEANQRTAQSGDGSKADEGNSTLVIAICVSAAAGVVGIASLAFVVHSCRRPPRTNLLDAAVEKE